MPFQTPSTPSGHITTLTPNASAKWTHPQGLAANGFQWRIVFPFDGAVRYTSAEFTGSIPHNATHNFTIGSAAGLTWAGVYAVEVRGRDTNNVWSNWTAGSVFTTNSAPDVPSGLAPASGSRSWVRPTLSCTTVDRGSYPGSAPVRPTAYVEIQPFDPAAPNELYETLTRTMAWNGTAGRYDYTVTSDDAAGTLDFLWRCYAWDGHLYSGATTVEADAARTAWMTFTLDAAPSVTITVPTSGAALPTDELQVVWTSTVQQTAYRVEVVSYYDRNGPRLLDSGRVSSALTIQGFRSTPQIQNGGWYSVRASLEFARPGVSGGNAVVSAWRDFTVSYTPPASVTGFTVTPVALATDASPTAALCQWTAVSASGNPFAGYDLYRTPVDGAGVVQGRSEFVALITDRLQVRWLDAEFRAGQRYRWDIRQRRTVTDQGIPSAPASAFRTVTFDGVSLGSVIDPEGLHVQLRYSARRGEEGSWDWQSGATFLEPFGDGDPLVVSPSSAPDNPSGTYSLFDDAHATAAERLAALLALRDAMGTICLRDGRGQRAYVYLDRVGRSQRPMGRADVALTFRAVRRDREVAS